MKNDFSHFDGLTDSWLVTLWPYASLFCSFGWTVYHLNLKIGRPFFYLSVMMLITKISRGRRRRIKVFYSCQCKMGQFSSFFFFFLFSKMPQSALRLYLEKQGLNYWTFALVVKEHICFSPIAVMQEMFLVINEDVSAFQHETQTVSDSIWFSTKCKIFRLDSIDSYLCRQDYKMRRNPLCYILNCAITKAIIKCH